MEKGNAFVVVGDFHVPGRAQEIPKWIRDWIEAHKREIDGIFCTGDLTEYSILAYLNSIAPTLCVRGNMDYLPLRDFEIVDVGGKRILLIHGHQVRPRGDKEKLYALARAAGADILIHGHTHKYEVVRYKGILMVNPGTATGAWGGSYEGGTESFALLTLNPLRVRIFADGKEVSAHHDQV